MSFVGGLPETPCGLGSTLEATKNVRAHLPGLLRDYGVKTLLDAPCGDCNWIAHTDLTGVRYIGIDFDAEHVVVATVRGFNAILGDVVNGHLPAADMMLCRDFLQHLPNKQVRQTIQNFKASNIPLLLATSHETSQNDDIPRAGGFRPLNLMARPFGFPDPLEKIEDGPRRILGLWRREDIPE